MSKLACRCGNSLSNVNCPSENIIHICKMDSVKQAIKENPGIRLWDFFEMIEEKLPEYWYCPVCGRITVVERISCGGVLKAFCKEFVENNKDFNIIDCDELFACSDVELDAVTELNFEITLANYVGRECNKKYFYDRKKEIVYVTDNELTELMEVYVGKNDEGGDARYVRR